MIKTTGFKRAFLMPSNRRPHYYGEVPGRRIGFHSQGFFPSSRSFFITSLFFEPGDGVLQYQKQQYPSGIVRSVSPSTFRRLFQLSWKK